MTSSFSNNSIAVIGAGSMIGSRFCELASESFKLIKADLRGEIPIDITSKDSVFKFFENNDFSTAILFSAFTDVDTAEKERNNKDGIVWKINVSGTENVVEASVKFRKKLIFLSTSFIFDGTFGPYKEVDETGPDLNKVGWYGITKIEGEKLTSNIPNYIILRITYPYRAKFAQKDDFAKTIIRKSREDSLYPMFTDQIFNPTFADDLFPTIKLLEEKDEKGIFHLGSPEMTTPYQFAQELLNQFKLPSNLKKGSLVDFLSKENATPRPVNGGLLVEKISKLGFIPTGWKQGISKIYQQSNGQLI